MVTVLRARVARWIQPATPAVPRSAEVAALADRVESGRLTPEERTALAELVMCAAAAHQGVEACAAELGANPAHGLSCWEPVGWQLTDLLRITARARAER